MVFDDVFQHIPYFGTDPFHHAFGALDVVGHAVFDEAFHYEGFKELQRHFLGETALVHFELRTDDDNGTAGVVHAFPEKVLTETPLFPFEHIAEGF